MIIVIGSILTNSENREAILAPCVEHSQRSRAEPGCISHNVHFDCEEPDRLVFVERWADGKRLAKHFAVPESGAFVQSVSKLSTEAPEMKIYGAEEVDPAGLAK